MSMFLESFKFVHFIFFQNQILYWCDFGGIHRVRYDGKNNQLILSKAVSNPYGLTVFNENLYWVDM